MNRLPTFLACAGCGRGVPVDEPFPFRCPAAREEEEIDHVLVRRLDGSRFGGADERRRLFLDDHENPFVRYRSLLHSHHLARARGVSDDTWISLVEELDERVARLEGRGFRTTPFFPARELASGLGLDEECVWIKDETGNVSGSHKGRHLFPILVWLRVLEEGPGGIEIPPLAIASCGNAALAAAVVARAAERPLDVFVPTWADPRVVRRLRELGAHLHPCPRREGETGDPCYAAFRRAVDRGALPFSCQGNENGLVVESGATLGYEVLTTLLDRGDHLDHLIVQVGGGALASSCILAFGDARELALLERLPRIHTVQTAVAHPLRRAWEGVARHLLGHGVRADPQGALEAADRLRSLEPGRREEGLRHAARHRSAFMWPWEEEPRSVATGILDDETYDWLAVVRGMMESGGLPLVASEEDLHRAHRLGRSLTPSDADATGTAGLAGLLALLEAGIVKSGERIALLFTGVSREG